jgi:HYR domain-containing protein
MTNLRGHLCTGAISVGIFALVLLNLAHAADSIPNAANITGTVNEDDCNDPDNPLPVWICREPPHNLLPPDYEYYVGHDEPEIFFYSNKPGSGNNIQWKLRLPVSDPAPAQDGSSINNRILFPTFWISLALCDPESTPFGACTPNSDTNTSASGSAILELQFYPPGSNCPGDNTKWCASLNIDELTTNCGEPVSAAPITTDGTPGGPRLLMSNGDAIRITIKDTANGMQNIVEDVTSGQTGSMISSGANGFMQTNESTHAMDASATCKKVPFDYHPEYLTALPTNNGSWINANVTLSYEIGHGELCGDTSCSGSNSPDGSDADDSGCGTVFGVGICTGKDNDHDGACYQPNWPDGNANHPSSLIIGNPLDDGAGPMSFDKGTYQAAYSTIAFSTSALGGTFYPFYSQAGTGHACVFNFGNDIPGTTTDDFGKTAQYKGLAVTMTNPCTGAPIAKCKNVTVPTDFNMCTTAVASIDDGSFDTDGDALTYSPSPAGPYSLGSTSVALTVTDTESLSDSCSGTVTVQDLQVPNISCPSPVVECTSPSGAVVTYSATASDNCPGVGTPSCAPPSGSTFPVGSTPFTCNVTDGSGNANSCSSAVKVQDTTPPIITSVSASPNELWPPNHIMVPIRVSVLAHDTCDPNPVCAVSAISSNQPPLGGGSGNFSPDYQITGPLTVSVRAERDGTKMAGRTYTITINCKDASGNTSLPATTTVFVPH